MNIPVDDLRSRLQDVPHDREIAVYCQVAAISEPAFCARQGSPRATWAAGTSKAGLLRMDTDLRIPMTTEQKKMLDDATADEPEGKAAWARFILLEAAKRKLTKRGKDMHGY